MKLILQTFLFSIIGLAVLAGAGYWFINNHSADEGDEISEVAKEIQQQTESSGEAQAAEPAKTAGVKKEAHVGMSEAQVQIYLHQMTHQKIVADKKRGAVEMSPENIKSMLTIVRKNIDTYEHSDFYEKTLTAWEQGEFSNAVTVHNTIWNWHKGTVGRARGLASAEQEAAYVNKHFK